MHHRAAPGLVRDSILRYLAAAESASIAEICEAVTSRIGNIPASSVRSYLNLNTPELFERTQRGRYRLKALELQKSERSVPPPNYVFDRASLYHASCFDWLKRCEPHSVHAILTDPPYGLIEYTEHEQVKLRQGRGGVWRIPPAFDGHRRSPLPRFTVLNDGERAAMSDFFNEFGKLALRATVPGANIIVASNPLLVHIVANAMSGSGLELRGHIVRLVMTMRGGDRPKNAHEEFNDVSVMPRSMFEPWLVMRHPLEGRAQDTLRKYSTGGFRRPSADKPFGDVIKSHPTPRAEKQIAAHPSLKPQAFLRIVARAALPLGKGVILDPFAGSGSTLAAANAIGYNSIGIEKDIKYVEMAEKAIPHLTSLSVKQIYPT